MLVAPYELMTGILLDILPIKDNIYIAIATLNIEEILDS